ncbi:hypothetical protein D1007_51757 [Hordeum vulgare]|nr:hypothetical protein D1007_51757 [Hordeum vulgare]KAI5006787.1 hypothetical protein ZWY2020_034030 [Hordeum vulgare]
MMASSAGGSSSGPGGDLPSIGPMSLNAPATEELHRNTLPVPPGCLLAKPWKVSKDDYATVATAASAAATREEAEIAAAIQAAGALAANPWPVVENEDNDIDWDNLGNSSGDDDGADGDGGAVERSDVVYLDESD